MYREVLVDVYAPEAVSLDQVSDERGMQCLERAMKHAAKTVRPQPGEDPAEAKARHEESKQYYLEDNEEYAALKAAGRIQSGATDKIVDAGQAPVSVYPGRDFK